MTSYNTTNAPEMVTQARYEARPSALKIWVWQVWDVTHEAECNHFPIATFDSNGAADDFSERHARLFLAALTQSPPPNDAVRELLREAREVVSDAAIAAEMQDRTDTRADDLFVLREQLDEQIERLSAQPAPVEGVAYRNLRVVHRTKQESCGPGCTSNTSWSEVLCDRPIGEGGSQVAHCMLPQDAEAIFAALHPNTESGRTPVAGSSSAGENA